MSKMFENAKIVNIRYVSDGISGNIELFIETDHPNVLSVIVHIPDNPDLWNSADLDIPAYDGRSVESWIWNVKSGHSCQ